jgi:hypothetical protein
MENGQGDQTITFARTKVIAFLIFPRPRIFPGKLLRTPDRHCAHTKVTT